MDKSLLIQPLVAGLSVGAFCLTRCFPFMAPLVAAEDRPLHRNLFIVLEFLTGRLAGYLCFGILAGWLGERFGSRWLKLGTDLSFILLSIVLVFYLLGLIREQGLFCRASTFFRTRSPALMGFLMGINICPPFLLSVLYVFAQKSPFYGMVYFALFFLASSVYFLPMIFIGMLASTRDFRKIARWSGFLTAFLFFSYGIYSLLRM